jgi:hypothetical protein
MWIVEVALGRQGDCCAAGFQSALCRLRVTLDTFGRGAAAILVRYASNSDQAGDSQRNVAKCQSGPKGAAAKVPPFDHLLGEL